MAHRIGQTIQMLRKGAKLTQFDLADKIGISHRQLQRIESGASDINMATLTDIAQALGVNPADLTASVSESLSAKAVTPSAPGTGRRLAQSESLNRSPASPLLTSAVEDALAILRSLETAPHDVKVLIAALLDDDPRHLEQSSRGFRQRWMQWISESLGSDDQSGVARKALK